MTNNKVCTDVSQYNEMCNEILHLEACDERKFFILDNWQDGRCTIKSTLIMEGAAPSLPHDTITDYRSLKGIEKFSAKSCSLQELQ